MKKKIIIIVIILILLGGLWLVVRFLIGGSEDTWICVDGEWLKHGVPSAPMPTEPCGEEKQDEGDVVVFSPEPDQVITTPLVIKGKARGFWYFEADFPIKVYDKDNNLLGISIAQAQGDPSHEDEAGWMTEDFVPFEAEVKFSAPATSKGVLVLEKDNPSGLPENYDELRIPIVFQEAELFSQETMNVKIFLIDSKFVNDPYFDCSRTITVERQVPKTEQIGRAAVEALLRGAKQEEISQGYISNINSGVRLKKITIENGIAKADFDEQLEFQVGGSCRVAAIRAQITETLKQFLTVDSVIISINGRTEDILQP